MKKIKLDKKLKLKKISVANLNEIEGGVQVASGRICNTYTTGPTGPTDLTLCFYCPDEEIRAFK